MAATVMTTKGTTTPIPILAPVERPPFDAPDVAEAPVGEVTEVVMEPGLAVLDALPNPSKLDVSRAACWDNRLTIS